MRRVRRTLSIRARTALVFALASMALTTAVLVFVNVTSLSSISTRVPGSFAPSGRATALPHPGPQVAPDPDGPGAERASTTLVAVVAVQQWQWSAVGITGAGVVAGGLGWFVSRRMLRPIDHITATANRISASNLHERIALDGPDDELRRLSRTVDDLLGRLETAFESQRRFVAQASHELRTPLTVQRAAMQIGLPDDADPDDVRRTREELLEQNRRTERLVESLLLLAEADRGLTGATEPVDLDRTIDDVVRDAVGAARAADVTVTREGCHGPPGGVRGEPMLVRQLLVNLVGNAVEYNEPGGFVRVTTRGDGFVVENSGPRVPDEVAPLLLEPFRRCPGAAGPGRHSGLGLSIVASIVQAHGWHLDIEARGDGGLRVSVASGGVSSV
ncbi:HAMP domain-containing histidine kinase [Curtobacterium flaccumfaciens pv. oortii]|uniref:sensor histidine kinase n=1 Tax=Curtobacterium flaccumfaciens TaxID=2035 RepID=UPI001BDF0B17|nr:HAMP domain-containing sensor histidine kinase [Curtobacterium flaccumfaciens]MBT1624244.1 HAMP domain-containing histidine kinase [Curtobacterium flaccumfaciens pv. oortii]